MDWLNAWLSLMGLPKINKRQFGLVSANQSYLTDIGLFGAIGFCMNIILGYEKNAEAVLVLGS